jgi:hypothetical protein
MRLIKAKRQKAAKKDDPNLRYRYAGQIFCEMLGQTCHKEFYDNIPGEYQEVPHIVVLRADYCRLSSFMGVTPPSPSIMPNSHIFISAKLHGTEGIISTVPQ